METIDQLNARHAAELAALQNQTALRDQLSMGPDSLMDTKGLGWWATYKCETLAQVADIVREFGPLIVPTVEWRNGCLSRIPLELYKERDRAKAADEGREVVFSLNVDQGRGFGPSVEFCFYIKTAAGDFIRIICKLRDCYRAGAQLKAPDFDRRGDHYGNGDAKPNPILRGIFHDHISWSPNVKGLDARYTYVLMDDGPEYRETLEILENTEIASWWKVAA